MEKLSNETIRSFISFLIKNNSDIYTECADSIAFAAFPFADENSFGPFEQPLKEMVSHSHSLRTLDLREIALDNLLRIEEEVAIICSREDVDLICSYSKSENQKKEDFKYELSQAIRSIETNLTKHYPLPHKLLAEKNRTLAGIFDMTEIFELSKINTEDEVSSQIIPKHRKMSTLKLRLFPIISLALNTLLRECFHTQKKDLGLLISNQPSNTTVITFIKSLNLGSILFQELEEYCYNLSSKTITILESRLTFPWQKSPPSYREIGIDFNLSHERVRQVFVRYSKELLRLPCKKLDLGDSLTKYSIEPDFMQSVADAASSGANRPILASKFLIATEFEKWELWGGIFVSNETSETLSQLIDDLSLLTDDHSLITDQQIQNATFNLFPDEKIRKKILTHLGLNYLPDLGVDSRCNYWSFETAGHIKISAALKFLDKSSSKEEIAKIAKISPEQVSSFASGMDNVARSDRYKWGFTEWIDDIYEGVVGEIEQRLDEHDGSVSLNLLIAEISLFGISERSIVTYANTDAYKVENGMLRRHPPRYKPQYPHSYRNGVFMQDLGETGLWGERITLQKRHFKGYSLHVNFDLAYANGLKPDTEITVPVSDNPGFHASIIWRPTATTRKIDVGKVSDLLLELGYVPDDQIIVVPTPAHVQIVSGGASTSDEGKNEANLGGVHSIFESRKNAG